MRVTRAQMRELSEILILGSVGSATIAAMELSGRDCAARAAGRMVP